MEKIFVFINGGRGTDWIQGLAMHEDGTVLAQHVSSNETWFEHDMGLNSDWKHEHYREHCPNGFELMHVEDPKNHEGLMAAYALNQLVAKKAQPITPLQE